MNSTVKVEFHDGVRHVAPISWEHRDDRPPKPIFDIPGYGVQKTVDGRYLAIKAE